MKTTTKARGGHKPASKKENLIPVCYLNRKSGMIEITKSRYEGRIEAKTIERVNASFLEKAYSGYFFPLEPMDAYQDVWLELERKAENMPELEKASQHTYLSAVANLLFLNWFKRNVEPVRQMYRAVEEAHYGENGAEGVDGFDADNYDATEEDPSSRMIEATDRGENECLGEAYDCSAWALAEEIYGGAESWAGRCWARYTLETLFPHLREETALGFYAYIKANGDFRVAAGLAGIKRATYYRKWPRWIGEARKVAGIKEA